MGYRNILKLHKDILIIGFLAVFSGNLGQTFLVGFFQPAISESFSLTSSEFGMAYSGVTLISGFLILFVGPLVDWWPAKRFATWVVCGMSLGILLLTLSPWAALALIGFGLIRFCGQGLFTHLGTTTVARTISQARGSALALVTLAIPLGEAVLPGAVALGMSFFSWREVWWILLASLLVVWLPALLRFSHWPPASHTRHAHSDTEAPVRSPKPLKEALFWRLSLMMLAAPIVNTGVFVFQADLTREFQAPASTFAIGFVLAAIGRLIGSLYAGRLVDRIGAAKMARLYLLPLALGLAAAVVLQNAWGILIFMFCAGAVTGMQEPTVTSLLMQIWGSEHLGKLRSTMVSCMIFSTGVAPMSFGLLLDSGVSFTTILGLLIAMVAVGIALAWAPLGRTIRATKSTR